MNVYTFNAPFTSLALDTAILVSAAEEVIVNVIPEVRAAMARSGVS